MGCSSCLGVGVRSSWFWLLLEVVGIVESGRLVWYTLRFGKIMAMIFHAHLIFMTFATSGLSV